MGGEETEAEVFVPGRLCVLGEHTDWAGNYRDVNKHVSYGMTIVCATNEGLYAKCNVFQPMLVKYSCVKAGFDTVSPPREEAILDLSDEEALATIAKAGTFFSYVAGTILSIMQWNSRYSDLLKTQGLVIDNYLTTLPMRKGLSSSAAVCVLVATCFSTVHKLNIVTSDLMEIAYLGEMNTPSQCGRMDQCVAMGRDTIGVMTFTEKGTSIRPLPVKVPLYFVVADLKSSKDTVAILSSLNKCYPIPNDENEFKMHIYTRLNQDISWAAIAAIESGSVPALSEAMTSAQQSFDSNLFDLCPAEFASPTLRKYFHDEELIQDNLYLSVKGVGSNGDGTIQFLCESAVKQAKLCDLLNSPKHGLDAFTLTIPATDEHQPLYPSRVSSALIIFSEDLIASPVHKESVKEYILNLMSCGVSHFGFVFKSRTCFSGIDDEDRCSQLKNQAQQEKDVEKVWDYCKEMESFLHSKVVCRIYHEGDESAMEVLTQAASHVMDAVSSTEACNNSKINLLCCFVSQADQSRSCISQDPTGQSCLLCTSLPSTYPPTLDVTCTGGHFDFLFANSIEKQGMTRDIAVVSSSEGRTFISQAKVLAVRTDLSNFSDQMSSLKCLF